MRRYTSLKPSAGTRIPYPIRLQVLRRDRGCVGFLRFPGDCMGALELDQVRASHGTGMKSRTCSCNLVSLCGAHHRYKTDNGKKARTILLDYLSTFEYDEDEAHSIIDESLA